MKWDNGRWEDEEEEEGEEDLPASGTNGAHKLAVPTYEIRKILLICVCD